MQTLAGARCAHSGARNSQLATRNSSSGFTLIELLVTMVIVTIIAAVILGTATAALNSARRSRTQTVVNRIHLLLMERWESYETRRIDLKPTMVAAINTAAGNDSIRRGQMMADLRLLALRELIKYEMPDRWSDVTGARLGAGVREPLFLAARPSLAESYLRLASNNVTEENEGAECLYALVMLGTGDGEARTMFSAQDIGDTDNGGVGDGAPEFLDGWGNPITFLRWSPGYVGRSNYMSAELDPLLPGYDPQYAVTTDHDPFDLYRRDQPNAPRPALSNYPSIPGVNMQPFVDRLRDDMPAFRMVPLVFSAGPDGRYGIISGRESDDPDEMLVATDPGTIALDPCARNRNVNPNDFYIGRPATLDGADESVDNITNHSISY